VKGRSLDLVLQGFFEVDFQIFVVSAMLNVGRTELPAEIAAYMRHWRIIQCERSGQVGAGIAAIVSDAGKPTPRVTWGVYRGNVEPVGVLQGPSGTTR
jgi:hypothetical protein